MPDTRNWSDDTLAAVDNLCLFDDNFMSLVFDENIKATEFLLRTIFGSNDINVITVKGQYTYKNVFPYRNIRLDIRATDHAGKLYDIEVQRQNAGAIPQRARFHSALMDSKLLKEKQTFKEIAESYVIFITQNDVIGGGLPLYHIDRFVQETNENFDDGSHIIYVNGAYCDQTTAIGKMVHDFGCKHSSDMYCEELKKEVQYYKETEGGRAIMSEIFEEYGKKQSEAARIEERQAAIQFMIENGMQREVILKNYSSEEYEQAQKEMLSLI